MLLQLRWPTFPLDAVVLLAVLVGEGIGARLGQQVLRGTRHAVLALGVLGAQGARRGQTLDVPAERTLAGAHSLAHRAARDHRVILGATRTHERFF